MWDVLRRNPVTLGIAVLMHVALVVLLVVGLDWLRPEKPKPAKVNVVQARVVDAEKLQSEVDKIKAAERNKQAEAAAKRKKEEQRLAEIERKRKDEKKKLAELEKKRKAEEAAQARRKTEAKKKAEQEKKRQADLKKEKEAEKKKLAEQERKRKAEQEKKAKADAEKKRKAAEAKKKADAERKRKEAEAQQLAEKQAREAGIAAQLAAEQDASETSRVVAEIQNKIQRNWLRPAGTAELGLKCKLRVRLANSGSVLLVQVMQSSGNGAFDRSVVAAVHKADPLPMPSSARLQANFRDINFEFDPSR